MVPWSQGQECPLGRYTLNLDGNFDGSKDRSVHLHNFVGVGRGGWSLCAQLFGTTAQPIDWPCFQPP